MRRWVVNAIVANVASERNPTLREEHAGSTPDVKGTVCSCLCFLRLDGDWTGSARRFIAVAMSNLVFVQNHQTCFVPAWHLE
jgi:hypothetical protein